MKLRKYSKSVKRFAALVAAASAFVTLPVLAGNMQGQSQSPSMETQTQSETKPMAPSTSPASNSTTSGSIVEVAASNGSFKTLTAALKAAGLDQTLASGGPYTVFAPTDEAFAALPEGVVEELLKPENKEMLAKVLTYHVVAGENTSGSLKTGETMTLEGAPVQVKVSEGSVMVNDANVVQADIKASNGVIHVIDKVILPPREQASTR
ncbi:MAG: fasciclin domain-containing protein [Coleofasciculus sp. Co-bin14]|nr:fasciclin domain-containing protein [Coleofasciculus sp. Co-bin14]